MAKKIKTYIKLTIPGGMATPAQPVGPALGQHGLPIMDFVKAFNDRTQDMKGTLIPAVITVYEDRTFDFIVKKPPIAEMIKKTIGKDKGAGRAGRETIATMTWDQAKKIAADKLVDLNTDDVDQAAKIVAGVARSMGVKVQ